ncbi:unnamed protein product [Dicrocoelium dendriticum]|nr:unnamed protein product [Dicrocoelium dendriticum]
MFEAVKVSHARIVSLRLWNSGSIVSTRRAKPICLDPVVVASPEWRKELHLERCVGSSPPGEKNKHVNQLAIEMTWRFPCLAAACCVKYYKITKLYFLDVHSKIAARLFERCSRLFEST